MCLCTVEEVEVVLDVIHHAARTFEALTGLKVFLQQGAKTDVGARVRLGGVRKNNVE